MKRSSVSVQHSFSIGAVERETGVSKDTLRVWEKRYGFPQPSRDEFGERTYPMEQLEKLRLVKCLLDQGHRPGKILTATVDELKNLTQQRTSGLVDDDDRNEVPENLVRYLGLCKAHQFEQLRGELSQALMRIGMYRFVMDIVAPLTHMVGAQWAAGELAIFEEHLYTESVQMVMRNAISSIPTPFPHLPMRPRVLLTTLPHEQHGLGLLMAEAIFGVEGAHCISLGVQTPVMEIVQATHSQKADIVALSFSASMNPRAVQQGLDDLQAKLPEELEIWVGGSNAILQRRPPAKVQVLNLHDIHGALVDWRKRHGM